VAQQRADGSTVRHLTDDDVEVAAEVFRRSLGGRPPTARDVERYRAYWDVGDSLGAFDADGRLLGIAATWTGAFTVEGGAALPCAAVPAVGVRPDSHGRGVGRALLERQVAEARERGAALMALNSSEVPIYGRYGYGPTSRWWSTRTDPRVLAWRDDAPAAVPGSVEEVEDAEEAAALLSDLHDRAFGSWAGELSRPPGWWHGTTHPAQDEQPRIHAVHRGEDGRVDAGITFTAEMRFDDTGFANAVEVRDAVAPRRRRRRCCGDGCSNGASSARCVRSGPTRASHCRGCSSTRGDSSRPPTVTRPGSGSSTSPGCSARGRRRRPGAWSCASSTTWSRPTTAAGRSPGTVSGSTSTLSTPSPT
jgi:GNAT superfamily N-acetyltransferase